MAKTQITTPKLRQPNGVFSHATAIEATFGDVVSSGVAKLVPLPSAIAKFAVWI